MSWYRRSSVKGGSFFFTVNLAQRGSDLLVREIEHLRDVVAETRLVRPFEINAMVILPDHLHAVWTLPPGDADFSTRWAAIKAQFTRRVRVHPARRSQSKIRRQEGKVWQRRFWEHCIRDEADYRAHVEYCWGNPVKHGLVDRVVDWPFSSIHRDIRAGRVAPEWTGQVTQGDFGE